VERLGRYEILEVLGRGAMGTVFRARDPKIDRIVAIKTITPLGVSPDKEDEYRQRFFREAHAAGKLSHPGLVTIYDVGEDESTRKPYIVMEYIAGRTLESLISDSKGKDISSTLDLLNQVAQALDYAHSQGIVHRDIKPANIIVTPQGRTKITDFGIAKVTATQLTLPGESPGTPSYMSTEQVTGGVVDGRSDLFSLGIILYSILVGAKPFTGENATVVTFKIAYKDPDPPSQLNPMLDPRFDYVIERALAKDPASRYQNGKELADDLEDLGQGRTPRSQGSTKAQADTERTVVQIPAELFSTRQRTETRSPAGWVGKAAASAIQLTRKAQVILGRATWLDATRLIRRVALPILASVTIILVLLAFRSIEPARSSKLGKAKKPVELAEPARTAKLDIRCRHSFRVADLFVWVDNELICKERLAGTVKKRLVFIKKTQGSFSDTLPIAPGRHVIRVQVVSGLAGYNQTKEVEAEWAPEGKKTLEIGFTESGNSLYLTLH
jgi:predicted Ser/Thr protein kinase